MNLQLITPATAAVVSLGLAKQHLRVFDTLEDGYIQQLIDVAQEDVDGPLGDLGRALLTSTWRLAVDAWPATGEGIEIPLPPLQTIDAVKYYDTSGVLQTLSAAVYSVQQRGTRTAVLWLAPGQVWPTARVQPSAVQIDFTAGWAAPKDVPARITQGILMMVAHWFEQRTPIGSGDLKEIPLGIQRLISPHRVHIGGTVFA